MKRFLVYTQLQIKKIMRTYPAMLVMTCLLALVLVSMLYIQARSARDTALGKEDSKAAIAITGMDSSPYLKLGLSMLENMDPSKVAVKFEEYDRENAIAELKSGNLQAVIELPEGMTDKLLAGNTDVEIGLIIPDAGEGLGPLLIRELSDCISLMIGKMESSSYLLADFYRESGVTSDADISAAQTDLLKLSLKKILQRGHMFTLKRMKTDATITVESYYLCAMFLLLVMLIGVMCAGTFIRTDYSLEILLKVRGLSVIFQILAEFLSLLVFIMCLGAIFIPAAGLGLSRMPIVFSELHSQTPSFLKDFAVFVLSSMPVILMIASLDLLLYEAADSLISGVLLQFLAMIALAYLSGVFYPVSSLPSGMKTLAPFLPTGQAMLYLRKLLIREGNFLPHMAFLLLYAAVFLLAACLMRNTKLAKVRH